MAARGTLTALNVWSALSLESLRILWGLKDSLRATLALLPLHGSKAL